MNKCQDILKIVRGNAFTLCLQIEARRPDGSAVDGFALEGDEMLNLLHNGESDRKTYERVGNSVFVTFDGDDELGWYGLEMTGVYADEQWRWCVPRVFQIVETNERANLPGWTILAEDTYVIGCGITLLSAVVHADWDVNDPTDPSYIKNKPDLNEFALATDLLATNQRVTSLENNTVKTVRQVLDDTMKATARDNISAASVAQLNAKQDSLTPGDGISIENNVISATGGGVTNIEGIMPIVFGTYNESTGAYDNTYINENSSGGASWLYDIAPNIHQELWSGSSEEATFRVSIDIAQGATNAYGNVLAYIAPTGSSTLKVSFSFEGVNYVVLFDVTDNHATTTAYKLSHLVANEENKFYDTGLYLEELVPAIGTSTYEKLSALKMSNAVDKMLLIRGFRSGQGAGTYAVATVKYWGSTFEFYVDDNGTTVHVQGDSQDKWTITRTTPYTKPSNGIPSSDLSSAVQTSLGKADSALQDESVFVAEYGVTTATEIQNAYAAGKTLFCRRYGEVYGCVRYTDASVNFGNVYEFHVKFCSINLINGGWSTSGFFLASADNKKTTITGNETSDTYYPTTKAVADYAESKTNKVTSLSSSSTDVEYPSAKAVWDEVGDINEVLDVLNGGDSGAFSNLYKMGVVSQTLTWDSTDNSYSVSNAVAGYIPIDFINNVTDAGATFDATTGYFSLNGITNIAYDEMREIYSHRVAYGTNTVLSIFGSNYKARTNFPVYWGFDATYNNHVPTTVYNKYLAYKNASITKFAFSDSLIYVRADSVNNFASNGQGILQVYWSRIEEIIGIIDVGNLTENANFFYNGGWMPWLTTFSIKNLNASINLSGMPKLSVATVKYMIVNAKTTTITITLNATCYDNIINDSEIVSALASKTNVTLAKAS